MPHHVRAAGGVLHRPHPDDPAQVQVALVHRPRYDDWSLPKGKLEAGEDPLVGALREVREETGFAGVAGRRLGQSSYAVLHGDALVPKTVHWWALRCADGAFAPSHEVDELRWCTPEQAQHLLSAGRDVDQLHRLLAGALDVSTAVLVRHAAAGSRTDWSGDDDLRPLTDRGQGQAEALVAPLRAYAPDRVLSAPLVRCRQTVAPLADALGLAVQDEPALADATWAADPAGCLQRVQELLATGGTPVLSSQGGVLPALLDALAARSGLELGPTHTRKGAAWVLSLRDGALVAADARPAPA